MNKNKKRTNLNLNEPVIPSPYDEYRRTHGDVGDIDDLIFSSMVEIKTHSER